MEEMAVVTQVLWRGQFVGKPSRSPGHPDLGAAHRRESAYYDDPGSGEGGQIGDGGDAGFLTVSLALKASTCKGGTP